MRRVRRLKTPENVTFELELAGLSARAAAWVVDIVLIGIATVGIGGVLSLVSLVSAGLGDALFPIVGFAAQWCYGAGFEAAFQGRTPGKRLLGLRVVDAGGFQVRFPQAALRNLLKVVDLLPAFFGTGALSVLTHPLGQRLGDVAAGTIVVVERRSSFPTELVAPAERYNSFLADPAVTYAARRVTAPERDAMVALALRRETLSLELRHKLFADLARHLETRIGLHKPAFFSDEKYVLHVASAVIGHAADTRTGP